MSCLFDFKYISIKAAVSDDFHEELREISMKADSFIEDNQHLYIALQLIWFFEPQKDNNWQNSKKSITQTFIAQSPVGDSQIELIIRYIKKEDQLIVRFEEANGSQYSCISSGDNCWVIIGGVGCLEESLGISKQASCAFSDLHLVLKRENLGFEHLVRQWNYIENIVGFSHRDNRDNRRYQHYQEFNEIRADWYSESGLTHDFPAATGIGTKGGGVIIDGIAARLDSSYKVLSLRNPEQEDAHSYSRAKLIGNQASSAPLFERGKMIVGTDEGYIWVSGTAAIRGEDSVSGNIVDQIRVTCENIDELISTDNLHKAGITISEFVIKPVYLRAYVKPGLDGLFVEGFLQQRYPDALVHVLYADICRDELLVEVEGEFRVVGQ